MSDPAIGTFSKVLGDYEQSWGTAKVSKTGFLFGVTSCSLTPSQSLISNPTLRGDFNSGDPANGPISASGSLVKVADVTSFPWFTRLLCGDNMISAGAGNYTHASIISNDIPLSAVIETSFDINGTLRYSQATGTRINRLSIPIEPTGFLTTSYDLMAGNVAISDTAYNAGGSAVKATGTLTSNGTAPSDGDTFKLGATTYTFKTALTGGGTTPNEVLIGTAAVTLDNLKSAVNATAGAGTTYGTGTTANASAEATTNAATYQVFQALSAGAAGNSIVFQDASLNLDTSALTLTGGSDAGATDWTANAPVDHLQLAAADVQIGGSPVGYISKGNIAIDANLNGNDYRVGASGARGSLVPGKYKVSGSLDLCLDSVAVLTLITAGTPVALSFKWASDANNYILVEVPRAFLQKTGPTLNGEGAVMVTVSFEAAFSGAANGGSIESMVKFTTGNTTSGAIYV